MKATLDKNGRIPAEGFERTAWILINSGWTNKRLPAAWT